MSLGFLRAIRFSLQNIIRNVWLSVVTTFLLFLTMVSITLVVSLSIIGERVINAVEQTVVIDFYFYDSATEEDMLLAQSYVESLPEVSSVIYVSKEQALKEFLQEHSDDLSIIAAINELETNILPASLVVRADTIDAYQRIIDTFQASDYMNLVERADYTDNKEIIDTVTHTTETIYQVGIVVSTVFIIISVVVIFNAIRMTIYSHKEEIGIMQLVGATNGFIRAPFILDSIFFGCVAAFCVLGLLYTGLYFSDAAVSQFFTGYHFSLLDFYLKHWYVVVLAEVVCAVLISGVSSMIAISRYLKV